MVSEMPPEDPVVEAIGAVGKWQYFVCFLMCLVKYPLAWNLLSISFLAPATHFRCLDNYEENVTEFDSKCVTNCSGYEYDRSIFTETIIMEFDLICDKFWLQGAFQSSLMLGVLFGSSFVGFLADRFGRRIPLIIAIAIQLCVGIATVYIRDFILLLCFRLILGCVVGGIVVTNIVIVMEMIGIQYREIVVLLFQINFSIAHTILPLFGYFFRSWRSFQMAITLPSLLLLIFIFVLPESPRWLISVGRKQDALKVMQQAAKWNKLPRDRVPTLLDKMFQNIEKNISNKKVNFLDLFLYSEMRKRSICTIILWGVYGCCFYGAIQYISLIGGNLFVTVALAGIIQIPGCILSAYCTKKIGRWISTIAWNILAACSFLAIAFIPDNEWLTIALGISGVLFTSSTFFTLMIYTSELYPTVARNMGVGLGSTSTRAGSMIAPFLVTMSLNKSVAPIAFGVVSLLSALSCFFLVPETKGKKLADKLEEFK